jgi:secreted trypsin-like serine protease
MTFNKPQFSLAKVSLAIVPLVASSIVYAHTNTSISTDKNAGKLHHQRGGKVRIIGGEEAQQAEYNYMTSMQFDGQHSCGASFIGGKWVLTAAHCVDGKSGPGNGMEVLIGASDFTNTADGKRVAVKYVYVHSEYNTPVDTNNDMALLELVEVVDAPSIKVISKSEADNLTEGTLLTVTGWGNVLTEGVEYPDKLMQVNIALVSNETCNLPASYGGDITDSMICAGYKEGGKDSCQGDSGGPLVLNRDGEYVQVGVVSFGEGCAQPDKYGVYAAAFNFHDWINSHIKGLTLDSKMNYGAVEEGAVIEKTVMISNNGDSEVKLSDFIVQGEGSVQLTVDSSACNNIAAQGECSLKISYNANTALGDTVTLTANSDSKYSPKISVAISALLLNPAGNEIATAVDGKDIHWFTESDYAWVVQSAATIVGDNGIKAAAINDDESSMLMAKVKGPAKLLFNVKTSSEKGYDFFDVLLDGKQQFYTSGKTEFEGRFIEIPDGEHRVTFLYSKDDQEYDGEDTVYLDGFERIEKITITPEVPTPAPITPKPVKAKSSSGGSFSVLLAGLLLMVGAGRNRKVLST